MLLRICLFLFAFGLSLHSLKAQDYISLQESGMRTIHRYFINESIDIKPKATRKWISTIVTGFNKDTVYTESGRFAFNDLLRVRVTHPWMQSNGTLLAIGGVGYAGIYTINGLLAKSYPLMSVDAAIASGVLFLSGYLIRIAGSRVYTLSDRYRFIYVNFNDLPNGKQTETPGN